MEASINPMGPAFGPALRALNDADYAEMCSLRKNHPGALIALVATEEHGEIRHVRISSPLRTPTGELAEMVEDAFTSSSPVWTYFRVSMVPYAYPRTMREFVAAQSSTSWDWGVGSGSLRSAMADREQFATELLLLGVPYRRYESPGILGLAWGSELEMD